MTKIIALLTDFGTEDIYVGVMKGVIQGICPEATLIDITHNIEPQNVRQAALALFNSYTYFPKGTVFLAVVDPGVGSTRRPIAVSAGGYLFVAPDNGLLAYLLAQVEGDIRSVELSNPEYYLSNRSNTFHGRDVFAPAAAHLADGIALNNLGNTITDLFPLPYPNMTIKDRTITGEVMSIDHFGNLITTIGSLRWGVPGRLMLKPLFSELEKSLRVSATDVTIEVHGVTLYDLKTSYSEATRGEIVALVGSSGFLEIAVNQGNAATRLGVSVGDPIEMTIGDVDAAIRD